MTRKLIFVSKIENFYLKIKFLEEILFLRNFNEERTQME